MCVCTCVCGQVFYYELIFLYNFLGQRRHYFLRWGCPWYGIEIYVSPLWDKTFFRSKLFPSHRIKLQFFEWSYLFKSSVFKTLMPRMKRARKHVILNFCYNNLHFFPKVKTKRWYIHEEWQLKFYIKTKNTSNRLLFMNRFPWFHSNSCEIHFCFVEMN